MYATDESDSEDELPSEPSSYGDEFVNAEMEAQLAADQQGSEVDIGNEDEEEDDEENRDVDGMPRGTKGRNMCDQSPTFQHTSHTLFAGANFRGHFSV